MLSLCASPFLNNVSALSVVTVTPSPFDSVPTNALVSAIFGGSMLLSVLFSLICYCIPLLIGLGLLAIWIWMLVDLLQRDDKDFGPGTNNKVIWLLVLLLTNWIGSIVYYFMIYNKFKKIKTNG